MFLPLVYPNIEKLFIEFYRLILYENLTWHTQMHSSYGLINKMYNAFYVPSGINSAIRLPEAVQCKYYFHNC